MNHAAIHHRAARIGAHACRRDAGGFWERAARRGMLFLALVAAPAAAQDEPVVDTARALAYLGYFVDAADRDGDVVADAVFARQIPWMLEFQEKGASDPALQSEWAALEARAQVVVRKLEARVEAARDEEPLLLAMEAHCPGDAARCAQARVRLAELAGDNAAFHLLLASLAWGEEDGEGFVRHARQAAEATRYDPGQTRLFAAMFRRLREVPHPPMVDEKGRHMHSVEGVLAMANTMAIATPAYGFVAPCRESEGELRRHCLQIARQLLGADAMIDVSIAKSLIDELGTPEDRAEATALYQRLQWQQAMVSGRDPEMVDASHEDVYGHYFIDLAAYGEVTALERMMERLDLPADPPPGWTPEQHYRIDTP